jgi:hypothetical protein
MRDDGRRARRLLGVIRRAVRWHLRSHRQVWAVIVAGYLVSVSAVLLIERWPRAGVVGFVTMAVIWIGVGIRQSYELQRRRNEQPR